MKLIILNSQGASKTYRNIETCDEARKIVTDEWYDPENLHARLYDGDEIVYEGKATEIEVIE